VFRNEEECDGDGGVDDANGYVDDCHGIDVVSGDSDPQDFVHGVGTAMAGVVAAVGNNGVGIAGIAWNVKVLACKYVQGGFATLDGLIECLRYVALMRDKGVNIVAAATGWADTVTTPELTEAILALQQRGVLLAVASGFAWGPTTIAPHPIPAARTSPTSSAR